MEVLRTEHATSDNRTERTSEPTTAKRRATVPTTAKRARRPRQVEDETDPLRKQVNGSVSSDVVVAVRRRGWCWGVGWTMLGRGDVLSDVMSGCGLSGVSVAARVVTPIEKLPASNGEERAAPGQDNGAQRIAIDVANVPPMSSGCPSDAVLRWRSPKHAIRRALLTIRVGWRSRWRSPKHAIRRAPGCRRRGVLRRWAPIFRGSGTPKSAGAPVRFPELCRLAAGDLWRRCKRGRFARCGCSRLGFVFHSGHIAPLSS